MTRIEMSRGAQTLIDVCARVQPDERVVIVTDLNKVEIAEVLMTLLVERGSDPVLSIMLPRETHGEEPPQAVADAILKADVVFAPTTYSLSHSHARLSACRAGARFISMPDYSKEMLIRGGLLADFIFQRQLVLRVAEVLTKAKYGRVITEQGTDMKFDLEGREGREQSGICTEPGSFGSPPDIEAQIAPVEGSAEGVLVVDGSIPVPEIGVIREPVRLIVKNGNIIEIQGGNEAIALRQLLEAASDPNVFSVGEFGIGLNPEARFIGRMLEDEGVLGTIHFGLGSNSTIGGKISTMMHTDCVVRCPTVEIDGQLLIDKGQITHLKAISNCFAENAR